jgi:uncharacterized protein YbaR (Trm112 family)
MVRLRCPGCKELLEFGDSARGTSVACPECDKKFRIPEAKPALAAPPARRSKPRVDEDEEDTDEDEAPRKKRPKQGKKKKRRTVGEAYSWGGLGVIDLIPGIRDLPYAVRFIIMLVVVACVVVPVVWFLQRPR